MIGAPVHLEDRDAFTLPWHGSLPGKPGDLPFDEVDTFLVYPIRLEERLPPIAVSLLPGDPPVTLDLQAVFDRCYDAGPYAREVSYGTDAVTPALGPDRAAWADRIVQAGEG